MLSAYVPKGKNSMNFILFSLYFTMATSMVTPKVNNVQLFLGKTRISPTRNLFIQRACETHGLDQNNVNFESF